MSTQVSATPAGKTIVIGEDDRAIAEVMTIVLQDEGYNPIVAESDDEIMRAIAKKTPALVFLDLHISGADGAELCKKIKQDPKTKNIPVIILSAAENIEAAAKEAGAEGILPKPFDIDDLVKTVQGSIA